MKFSVTMLLGLLLFACSTSPLPNNALAKNKSTALKDTLFLERSVCDNFYRGSSYHFYHAVYVETNRNSEYYNQLADFSFTDSENLDEYNKNFKRKGIRLSKINTTDLPKEWVPLYQYKKRYYVYSPSEQGNLNRRILNDSLLICWYLDGPYPYVISSAKKISDSVYSITTKDVFNNRDVFAKPEILTIYIIDKKNKIAIWEYKSKNDKNYFYRLFVAKENITSFDMIINYCLTDKQMEFNFDEPDFATLLKKKQLNNR